MIGYVEIVLIVSLVFLILLSGYITLYLEGTESDSTSDDLTGTP